jgi:hypothetical protein
MLFLNCRCPPYFRLSSKFFYKLPYVALVLQNRHVLTFTDSYACLSLFIRLHVWWRFSFCDTRHRNYTGLVYENHVKVWRLIWTRCMDRHRNTRLGNVTYPDMERDGHLWLHVIRWFCYNIEMWRKCSYKILAVKTEERYYEEVDGGIILKWMYKKYSLISWTGSVWVRISSTNRVLWAR